MEEVNKKTRSFSLDLIRVIAIMCVLMIHTAMNFVSFETSSFSFVCGNVLDGVARLGVPLFVMVSGALMLDENKNIDLKTIYKKNILSIFLLFIVWSLIYTLLYVFKAVIKAETLNFLDIIREFVSGKFHMWYLFMIIGLYIITPVLKLFVKKENAKWIKYIIFVSLIFCFMPTLFDCLNVFSPIFGIINEQLARFDFVFIGVYGIYFVTGWYLKNIEITHKKTIYVMSICSLALIIILMQITVNHKELYLNSNPLIYLYSIGVFTFINDRFKGKNSNKIIAGLSNLSFGVYIIHILVLEVVNMFYNPSNLWVLHIAIKYILITIVSFGGVYIMSKIPLIKKLVRF